MPWTHWTVRSTPRAASGTAFDVLSDSSGSSGAPAWCYWMTEAQALARAGYCYLRLGDHGRARAHLRSGTKQQARRERWTIMF
ncbi:hypothetical protein GCM10023193_44640 [Planotetraspora kaengkrachanensis]|uniref:Uncharacterized protein n=1 Tax=Planotetraspora kaengkrachanensis TaxID=575193 RepID=A0A8J3VAK9_9ACTN|nr:hypothetical protein Pka01_64930 [Planotetraspora kaengkrachanensis]